MARYKSIHKGLKLLPVDFDRQVTPVSFEHALCHLVAVQRQQSEIRYALSDAKKLARLQKEAKQLRT